MHLHSCKQVSAVNQVLSEMPAQPRPLTRACSAHVLPAVVPNSGSLDASVDIVVQFCQVDLLCAGPPDSQLRVVKLTQITCDTLQHFANNDASCTVHRLKRFPESDHFSPP